MSPEEYKKLQIYLSLIPNDYEQSCKEVLASSSANRETIATLEALVEKTKETVIEISLAISKTLNATRE